MHIEAVIRLFVLTAIVLRSRIFLLTLSASEPVPRAWNAEG